MQFQNPTPGKGLGDVMRQVALATELPLIMVGGVVVGGAAGYLLDSYLHTQPIFMLVGGIAGFVTGVWEIIRRLSADEKRRKKSDGANGN
jgi:F0F1-type ATP synthase assembly protein I